jgi:hypothetical protein
MHLHISLLTQFNDEVKENEMDTACSMGENECVQDFNGKARRKETSRKT